jgi:integrase
VARRGHTEQGWVKTEGDGALSHWASKSAQEDEMSYIFVLLLPKPQNLSAHCFRHGLGSKMLEETGDLAAVQDLLGHASPETTRRYAKLSHKHLKKVYDSVFD